jgi:glutamate synthase (NADPH/NADH) small chain
MDAARTALRLGAENVKIVYRRSRSELPARAEEVHHAEEEGIEFLFLTNPQEYLGDEQGKVRAMICDKMELGEPDASGRRRPVKIPDSAFELATDCVIVAAGALANPLLTKNTSGLNLNKWGYIVTDEKGQTSRSQVWAGRDIVTGSATVILAMGAGRTAAQDIHRKLGG